MFWTVGRNWSIKNSQRYNEDIQTPYREALGLNSGPNMATKYVSSTVLVYLSSIYYNTHQQRFFFKTINKDNEFYILRVKTWR